MGKARFFSQLIDPYKKNKNKTKKRLWIAVEMEKKIKVKWSKTILILRKSHVDCWTNFMGTLTKYYFKLFFSIYINILLKGKINNNLSYSNRDKEREVCVCVILKRVVVLAFYLFVPFIWFLTFFFSKLVLNKIPFAQLNKLFQRRKTLGCKNNNCTHMFISVCVCVFSRRRYRSNLLIN